MSSSFEYVGLKILRSAVLINKKPTTTTSFNLLITTRLKVITTKTIIRGYHHCLTNLSTIDINNQRQYKQTQQTAVKNIFLLKTKQKPNEKIMMSFHKYKNIVDAPPGVFKGLLDRFNGVTIDSVSEFSEQDNFAEKLQKSLDYWQEQKRRAIWFIVRTEHSDWIPFLTKMHFEFHHAKTGFVVLCRWLPKDEYPNLPVYSHTMVGVGGLVVNAKNEILVVSERFALISNSWKLPGGYAEPRENLIDAVIREVHEETGVNCIFDTVICLRHAHGGPFGCSDIYCVIALTPTSFNLKRCEREISKVKWIPCDEYLQHPNVHETNRHFLKCYFDYKKRGIRFTCELAQHQILKKEYCLYYMKAIEEEKLDDKTKTSELEDSQPLKNVQLS